MVNTRVPNEIEMKELPTRWDYADEAYENGIPESFRIDQSKHSLFGSSKVSADISVQEYGRSNPELLEALHARGSDVTNVRVYQWDLPENTGPLCEAARRLAAGQVEVALFTTSVQIAHLARVARPGRPGRMETSMGGGGSRQRAGGQGRAEALPTDHRGA